MPWHFRAQRARALGWAAAALLTGMLLTSLLGRVYGAGESSFYARPAFFVYGLVRGTNEEQAYADFASRRGEFPNESRFARFVFAEALSEFRRHPATLVASCASGAGRVVEKNAKALAGIVNVTRIPNAFRDGPGAARSPGRACCSSPRCSLSPRHGYGAAATVPSGWRWPRARWPREHSWGTTTPSMGWRRCIR